MSKTSLGTPGGGQKLAAVQLAKDRCVPGRDPDAARIPLLACSRLPGALRRTTALQSRYMKLSQITARIGRHCRDGPRLTGVDPAPAPRQPWLSANRAPPELGVSSQLPRPIGDQAGQQQGQQRAHTSADAGYSDP